MRTRSLFLAAFLFLALLSNGAFAQSGVTDEQDEVEKTARGYLWNFFHKLGSEEHLQYAPPKAREATTLLISEIVRDGITDHFGELVSVGASKSRETKDVQGRPGFELLLEVTFDKGTTEATTNVVDIGDGITGWVVANVSFEDPSKSAEPAEGSEKERVLAIVDSIEGDGKAFVGQFPKAMQSQAKTLQGQLQSGLGKITKREINRVEGNPGWMLVFVDVEAEKLKGTVSVTMTWMYTKWVIVGFYFE